MARWECNCARLAFFWLVLSSPCNAAEDIEFVAEHLPEVAMDNRYASLPLWDASTATGDAPAFAVESAYSRTETGHLTIDGPLFSVGFSTALRGSWRWGALAFYDPLRLRATRDARPLQTLFSPHTPIARPAPAEFRHLDGRAEDFGGGVFISHPRKGKWLGEYTWTAGVLWQRVSLRDYRLDYRITDGPQTGMTGRIDFDADYTHVAPFIGLQRPWATGAWMLCPRALLVLPLPRHGIEGHITGPDFDLHGNTEDVGEGKHFGDLSVTLGLGVRYGQSPLSIDLGALLTQAVLEPHIHRGIDNNYVLSASWQFR